MPANAGKYGTAAQPAVTPVHGTIAPPKGERTTADEVAKPGNARIIFDISTMEQAGKVEESVKTGYVEAVIENVVRWIGVEEDLADSYEKFSKSLRTPEEREAANELHIISSSDADMLRKRLEEFEGLESEQRKRIQRMKKLSSRT